MNTESSFVKCPQCGSTVPPDAPQGLCPRCVLAGAAIGTEPGIAAARMVEPKLETVRKAFPELEVIELAGRGGMGFVYKARQVKLDRWVALKLLPIEAGSDPAFVERFHREARALARLHHPAIVAIHDFGVNSGFCYLLMEFVEGVNLRQAMRAGRFSPGEALSVVSRICEAIQYAHDRGVLHRDIKPENILMDAQGRLKIADFGIAKLVGEDSHGADLTQSGARLGTVAYMAPEQIEKPSSVDHRADVYSLGVVFYELLTGELPLGRFAPPSAKANIDAQVDDIVMRALAKERELRQQSAGQVKSEVEAMTEGGTRDSAKGSAARTEESSTTGDSGAGFVFAGIPAQWKPLMLVALGVVGCWLVLRGFSFFPSLLFLMASTSQGGMPVGVGSLVLLVFVGFAGVLGWLSRGRIREGLRALGLVAPRGASSLDRWLGRASVLVLVGILGKLVSGVGSWFLIHVIGLAGSIGPWTFIVVFGVVCALGLIGVGLSTRRMPNEAALRRPPWIRRAAICFLVVGAVALVPTYVAWQGSVVVWHRSSLALITGLALWSGSVGLRRLGLLTSGFGFLGGLASAATLPILWRQGVVPNVNAQDLQFWFAQSILLGLAEIVVHGASLAVLLHSDVRAAFGDRAAQGPRRWFSVLVWLVVILFVLVMESRHMGWNAVQYLR